MTNFNIYVDELPKSCKECEHTIYWDIDDVFVCSLDNRNSEHLEGDDYKKGLKLNSCPLKPLSVALAEERKKVVQEIWKGFEQILMGKTKDMSVMKVCNMINSVLDKIERGK